MSRQTVYFTNPVTIGNLVSSVGHTGGQINTSSIYATGSAYIGGNLTVDGLINVENFSSNTGVFDNLLATNAVITNLSSTNIFANLFSGSNYTVTNSLLLSSTGSELIIKGSLTGTNSNT